MSEMKARADNSAGRSRKFGTCSGRKLPTISQSTRAIPAYRNCINPTVRDLWDTRVHPSKFSKPSSAFVTYEPPPCEYTYTGLNKQSQSKHRTSPAFSLYERQPLKEEGDETPGPVYDSFGAKYDKCEDNKTRMGTAAIHGPRYYPDFRNFGKDPLYQSRRSILDECGKEDVNRVLCPGRYDAQKAFQFSSTRIQEPQYSWASRGCIQVISPKKGAWSKPGRKMLVEWAKTPEIVNVKVSLWRARRIVQIFEESTSQLSSTKRLKRELVPGIYRFRVEDVSDAKKYAWSPGFRMELASARPISAQSAPVFTTFGAQIDSNKRSQTGTSFGWKR